MRYLGLDVGSRAIGIAVGESIASELTTIRCSGSETFYETATKKAIEQIDKILHDEECDAVVVGLPVSEQGALTSEAKKIQGFAKALENSLDVKIHFVNETLTTFMASDMLESQGYSIAQAKQKVDQLAAQLILQQYLEENEEI